MVLNRDKVTFGRQPIPSAPIPVPDYLLNLNLEDLAQLMQYYCSARRDSALDVLLTQSLRIASADCTRCETNSATARLRLFLASPPNFPHT